jgi:RND family efflux transporter MFP subunit
MKKIIFILVCIIVMAAGIVRLNKEKQTIAEAPLATPPTFTVRIAEPQTKTVSRTRTFLAKMEPVHRAGISSKLSGRISGLAVAESDAVQQGDLLVRIDDLEIVTAIRGLQAQLVSAGAQRDYSATVHQRNLVLFEAGGLAREKLEASQVALRAAVAAVKDLQQKIKGLENQLEYLHLKAPFAGRVGTIFLRQGDLAAPGRPILTLNSLEQKLTFSFMAATDDIRVGQDVLLQGTKAGRVVNIYDDAHNGLSVAEVALDRRLDLPGGSYLTIVVVGKTASGCAVPVRALLHRSRGTSVMVYQEDNFAEKAVTVTVQDGEFALLEPCVAHPVAVASEAKLSLLPTSGRVRILPGETDE